MKQLGGWETTLKGKNRHVSLMLKLQVTVTIAADTSNRRAIDVSMILGTTLYRFL